MKYKYTCIDEEEILDIYKNDPDFDEWFKIVKKIYNLCFGWVENIFQLYFLKDKYQAWYKGNVKERELEAGVKGDGRLPDDLNIEV